MDMRKTAREIGLFETALNISKVSQSTDVALKVGASVPLPGADLEDRIEKIAHWLLRFGKRKYMFLTPELALIEAMAQAVGKDEEMEIIITVPCDMDEDTKARLKNNCPRDIKVTILEEPYFPQGFMPYNGMIVACGYASGNRFMLMADTYRMIEHYSGFWGKKVFVSYADVKNPTHYDGWMEANPDHFKAYWRETV